MPAVTNDYSAAIAAELKQALAGVSEAEVERLVDAIAQAGRVFVAGAGRSGLMMRAFAMRLMHLGLDAYVVGETVTRSLAKGDLLIIGTGSGETKSLVPMAEKARSLGAVVAAFTISPASTIGRLADVAVLLSGAPKDRSDGGGVTAQPMGSLFEQTLLVLGDAVILRLMEKLGLDGKAMYGNHANLE
ncbi:6-phospho-3-hexuloisomerase [Paenibacillus sp. YIM B09110]|uniref:6-phospho-3-hexuloisomerase n=1 Tax=Paenibacillus sp. YIM B09110 TaxID=3126102 RepID=UPI00301DD9D8